MLGVPNMDAPRTLPSPVAAVLIHGFGGSARTWDGVASRLAGVRCLAVDLPGFGDAADVESDFTVAQQADAVAAAIAAAQIDRFILVGASMGGKIATALAARRPAGLVGLLLLAPSPPTPEPMDAAGRASLLDARRDEASATNLVHQNVVGELDDATLQQAVADALRTAPAAWRAWAEAGSREDVSDLAKNVDVPVRLLVGDGDANLGEAVQRSDTLPLLRGATLSVVAGAGHLLPLDAPQAVAAAAAAMASAGAIWSLMQSSRTTRPTRTVLTNRLQRPATGPRFFDAGEMATLRAVCLRLVPPPPGTVIDVAAAIDERLANGGGDGWRFDVLPPDGEAFKLGLKLLDDRAGGPFADADAMRQEAAINDMQRSHEPAGGLARPDLFFEDLLAEAAETYFAHPAAQAAMDYVGFADAGGWEAR